ncbi:carbon-nitrogen hydrolase family protein [Cryobacterium sp. TmT2-59]|uniref:carbon-nitrogen hydrolase family protein n=1 Tax=Cryobacterium sp. TmT2-59 TaxID=1259264 RepID=UPI00106A8BFF|nr:carbon-nitrogen hydrolase family protein [Cryobacterium sp. TmT2-59]TFC81507.1 carbon-nitrogen hydrolase family protein [Cryobacterium sp. TmT2-59]
MKLSIAGLQTAGSPGNVASNLGELRAAARTTKAGGGELLITPELFLTGYNLGDKLFDLAKLDLLIKVQEIAREEGLAMIVGLPEYEEDRLYNSVVFLDEGGAVLGHYRKTHLFGSLDRELFTRGEQLVSTVDYRGVRLAMLICYDVEFPETVRAAALAGAHAVIVATAQMTPFKFIAEQLIPVRAWENQIYMAYVNHDGEEGDLAYVGRSSIVDPYARVLDSIVHGTRILTAVIDTEIIDQARLRNPYLNDRRPDLYDPSASAQTV